MEDYEYPYLCDACDCDVPKIAGILEEAGRPFRLQRLNEDRYRFHIDMDYETAEAVMARVAAEIGEERIDAPTCCYETPVNLTWRMRDRLEAESRQFRMELTDRQTYLIFTDMDVERFLDILEWAMDLEENDPGGAVLNGMIEAGIIKPIVPRQRSTEACASVFDDGEEP